MSLICIIVDIRVVTWGYLHRRTPFHGLDPSPTASVTICRLRLARAMTEVDGKKLRNMDKDRCNLGVSGHHDVDDSMQMIYTGFKRRSHLGLRREMSSKGKYLVPMNLRRAPHHPGIQVSTSNAWWKSSSCTFNTKFRLLCGPVSLPLPYPPTPIISLDPLHFNPSNNTMPTENNMHIHRPLTIVPGSDPSCLWPGGWCTTAVGSAPTNLRTVRKTTKSHGGFALAFKASEKINIAKGSPLNKYKKRYCRNVGSKTIIIQKEGCDLFAVKVTQRTESRRDTILCNIRQIPHPSFRYVQEIFVENMMEFVVYTHNAITLREIERCPVFPTEVHVATIASSV